MPGQARKRADQGELAVLTDVAEGVKRKIAEQISGGVSSGYRDFFFDTLEAAEILDCARARLLSALIPAAIWPANLAFEMGKLSSPIENLSARDF